MRPAKAKSLAERVPADLSGKKSTATTDSNALRKPLMRRHSPLTRLISRLKGNVHGGLKRRISRSAVREYIKRLRLALELTFKEAALNIDYYEIVSEQTVMNEVGYRLKATAEWRHQPPFAGSDRTLKMPEVHHLRFPQALF
jgi:hypothetical protein